MDTENLQRQLLARRAELRSREVHTNAALRQQPDLSGVDFGDESTHREQSGLLSALSRAAAAELSRIERALHRIEEGRYGTCSVCGEEIEPQRLQAVPYADRCIMCAERANGS